MMCVIQVSYSGNANHPAVMTVFGPFEGPEEAEEKLKKKGFKVIRKKWRRKTHISGKEISVIAKVLDVISTSTLGL